MTADEYVISIINKYNVSGEVDVYTKLFVVDQLVKIIRIFYLFLFEASYGTSKTCNNTSHGYRVLCSCS